MPRGAVVVRRGIVAIKPLGLGDLLEGAFQAMRHNPKVMILVTLGVLIVTALVGVIPLAGGLAAAVPLFGDGEPTTTEIASGVTALVAGSLLTVLLTSAGSAVTTGLLSPSVAQAVIGRRLSLRENWRRTRGRVWRLIGLGLLVTLILGAAPVLALAITAGAAVLGGPVAGTAAGLLLVPLSLVVYVWLYVSTLYAPVVVVLERSKILTSVRRSFALTRRNFWRTFGVWLLSYVIVSVVAGILSVPFSILYLVASVTAPDNLGLVFGSLALQYVGQAITYVISFPYLAAIVVLLYTDRRIRTEGLDIALSRAMADPQ